LALARGARDRRRARLHCEARVGAEALGAGGAADQDRRGQRAAAGFGEQLGAVPLDQLRQLRFERVRSARQAADLRDPLARDPHPRAGRQPPQPPIDAVEHPRLVERAGLQ
jgi:hypothetical protein